MTNTHSRLLSPEQCVLLVIDIQEKFIPAIPDCDSLISRTCVLIQACERLGVPVVVSEQYPKGLGPTVAPLSDILPAGTAVIEKTAFGCGGDPEIRAHLKSLNGSQIMVCGIEAHVCVNQTVHQLLSDGYQVHLIQDAIASRKSSDAKTAISKMLQSGAIPGCFEMALFEMMSTAQHPQFKAIQALVK